MNSLLAKIPDRTLEQQALASNPKLSAWVSANAGSGKTHVLANRVVRLLLEGVNPSRILALTFTKTAAGEMAKRVFKMLGEWSVLPDDDLRKILEKLQEKKIVAGDLFYARTLFARSLETPGGLKIQTIHAFCEALLHQFPLEANVAGNFSVLDPSDEQSLMEDARNWVILQAESGKRPDLANAFAAMMAFASDNAIGNVMSELIGRREEILDWLEVQGGAVDAEKAARLRLNFGPDEKPDDIRSQCLAGLPLRHDQLRELANIAAANPKEPAGEQRLARTISLYLASPHVSERFAALEEGLLKKDGDRYSDKLICSKRIDDEIPGIREELIDIANRLAMANARIRSLVQIVETKHLMVLSEAMLKRYRILKRSRGQLDFNDLIARSADLLLRKEARAWVLYKLDLGIDHVLLDEAQDTSPAQWSIVNALVDEFFSGEGASGARRTIFAVGDEKQSIYSFQGARPQSFSEQKRLFEKQARGADKTFKTALLDLSFRSTNDVLTAVDATFDVEHNRQGLTSDNEFQPHTTLRRNAPGRVEIWDKLVSEAQPVPEDWTASMDEESEAHPSVKLANLIAEQIQRWLNSEELIYPRDTDGKPRAITPGDIIVLVRSRDTLIPAFTRSLKERNIPVAGTDRLAITDHIAIKDMIALGNVMLTPQDDLSLAALLRSPLFDVCEQQLMDLALGRDGKETLFDALKNASGSEKYGPVFEKLTRWMDRADAVPVYEFFARILGDDRARHSLYARLGPEAEDVLDAFLALTLKHEQSGLPGLHAFLHQLEMGDAELKRELADGRGEVRVMTVHAAKGQEAPIVFLVDKSSDAYVPQHRPALYQVGSDKGGVDSRVFLWAPSASDHGDPSKKAEEEIKRLAEEEYRRLLYVGMTRAEDRLIICGYKSSKATKPPNWHDMVKTALEDRLEEIEGPDPEINAWRMKSEVSAPDSSAIAVSHVDPNARAQSAYLPPWLNHRMPKETALPRPLSPSGAQALIEEHLVQEVEFPSVLDGLTRGDAQTSPFARLRGTAIHKLLQVWPELDAKTASQQALTYLKSALPDLTEAGANSVLACVTAVIQAPELAPYFDPATSRAEVPVMGRIDLSSGPRPVSGTIDRLADCGDHIMLLDYKTTAVPPRSLDDVPEDYITQMALYRVLVQRIYPQKNVRAMLIWTHAENGPNVMHLPDEKLSASLERITAL